MRADVPTKITQVFVRPGRADFAIKPRLRMLAVPTHAEAVAIGGGGRLQRPLALNHERVRGGGYILFQRDRFAAIGYPATHRIAPEQARSIAGRCGKAMAR